MERVSRSLLASSPVPVKCTRKDGWERHATPKDLLVYAIEHLHVLNDLHYLEIPEKGFAILKPNKSLLHYFATPPYFL